MSEAGAQLLQEFCALLGAAAPPLEYGQALRIGLPSGAYFCIEETERPFHDLLLYAASPPLRDAFAAWRTALRLAALDRSGAPALRVAMAAEPPDERVVLCTRLAVQGTGPQAIHGAMQQLSRHLNECIDS